MSLDNYLILLLFLLPFNGCEPPLIKDMIKQSPKQQADFHDRELYLLKTYLFDTDTQAQITDHYLEKALLPGCKELGIQPIGVFKARDPEEDSVIKTWVLIPFSSWEQFQNHEAELAQLASYLDAGKEYLNAAHDQPPYRRMESVLLSAFTDMPQMQTPNLDGPRADRVYELRSYESATEADYRNKVDMFNRGGEIKLFDRLGFNAVFYGEVLAGNKMPNLMYLTTFANQASRDEHWEAFVEAPEWKKLIAMPEYENNVSHVDILYLYPTAYSDY